VLGVTVPVELFMVRPEGEAVYTPPAVPVRDTVPDVVVLQYGDPA